MNTQLITEEGERVLSWEERARWGKCPVCGSPAGESCVALATADAATTGAHLIRLSKAPFKVRVVPPTDSRPRPHAAPGRLPQGPGETGDCPHGQ